MKQVELIFNIKAGILFIPDYENFQNYDDSIIPDRNKIDTNNNIPLFTFYKYIGKKILVILIFCK